MLSSSVGSTSSSMSPMSRQPAAVFVHASAPCDPVTVPARPSATWARSLEIHLLVSSSALSQQPGHVDDAPLFILPVDARRVRVASVETIAQIKPGLFGVAPRDIEGRGALFASTPNQLDGLERWAIGMSLDKLYNYDVGNGAGIARDDGSTNRAPPRKHSFMITTTENGKGQRFESWQCLAFNYHIDIVECHRSHFPCQDQRIRRSHGLNFFPCSLCF